MNIDQELLDFDNHTVKVWGNEYKVRVSLDRAIWPRHEYKISAWAEMLNCAIANRFLDLTKGGDIEFAILNALREKKAPRNPRPQTVCSCGKPGSWRLFKEGRNRAFACNECWPKSPMSFENEEMACDCGNRGQWWGDRQCLRTFACYECHEKNMKSDA